MVDDTLTWNNHIDQLIARLNSACYAIRAVNAMLSRKGLKMLYFLYVHSIISYVMIFWVIPLTLLKYSESGGRKKKVLSIMNTSKKMDSRTELCKTMEILPLYSQYIFSLFNVCGEQQTFIYKNLEVHNHDTRSVNNFHLPITNLTKYQK